MSDLFKFLEQNNKTELACGTSSEPEPEKVCNLISFTVNDDQQLKETTVKVTELGEELDNPDGVEKLDEINDKIRGGYDGVLELLASNLGDNVEGASQCLMFDIEKEDTCDDSFHPVIQFNLDSNKQTYYSSDLDIMTPYLPVDFGNKFKLGNSTLPFAECMLDSKATGDISVKSCGVPKSPDGTSMPQIRVLIDVHRKLTYELTVKTPPVFTQKAALEGSMTEDTDSLSFKRSSRLLKDTKSEEYSESYNYRTGEQSRNTTSASTSGGVSTSRTSSYNSKQGVTKTSAGYEVEYQGNKYSDKSTTVEGANFNASSRTTTLQTGLIYAKRSNVEVNTGLSDNSNRQLTLKIDHRHLKIDNPSQSEKVKNNADNRSFTKQAAEKVNSLIEFKINGQQPPEVAFISGLYNLKNDVKKFLNDLQGLVPAIGFKVSFDFRMFDGTLKGTWGKRHDKELLKYDHVRVLENHWDLTFDVVFFGFDLSIFCGIDLELKSPRLYSLFGGAETLFALKAGIGLTFSYQLGFKGNLKKASAETEYPNIESRFAIEAKSEVTVVIMDAFGTVNVKINWALGEKFFFKKKAKDGKYYYSIDGIKWYSSQEELVGKLNSLKLVEEHRPDGKEVVFDSTKAKIAGGKPDPDPEAYPGIAGSIQPEECVLTFEVDAGVKPSSKNRKVRARPYFKPVIISNACKKPVWNGDLLG